MNEYSYRAYERTGKEVSGTLRADTKKLALAELERKGLHLFAIEEKDGEKQTQTAFRFSREQRSDGLIIFTRQLANLLLAGIQLGEALQFIGKILKGGGLKATVDGIYHSLQGGKGLAESLAAYPDYFSSGYISMIRAGEESGFLGLTCQRLADNLEEKSRLRSFIVSSLIYPLVLIVVASTAIMVMLLYVLPRFISIFETYNRTLPWTTSLLLKFSNILAENGGGLLLGMAAVILWWLYYRSTPTGRELRDRFYLKVPLVKGLVIDLTISRIADSLATMLESGVPLLKALQISAQVSNNCLYCNCIERISRRVERGESLSSSLEDAALFSEMSVYLVGVGEQTGKLTEMLRQVASFHEQEYRNTLERMLKLFEPLLLLLMGSIIGFIVISMLLPIMGIGNLL